MAVSTGTIGTLLGFWVFFSSDCSFIELAPGGRDHGAQVLPDLPVE